MHAFFLLLKKFNLRINSKEWNYIMKKNQNINYIFPLFLYSFFPKYKQLFLILSALNLLWKTFKEKKWRLRQ